MVIINRRLAEIEWPGVSPIGQRMKYPRGADAPLLTVIGVVSDIHHLGPGEPSRPELYLPYAQRSLPMMAVAVRTAGDPMALVPAIRAEVFRIDASQPISGVSTMAAHLDQTYGRARFLATLTLLFGAAMCLLAVIGVYGVTSVAVAQRTREFGVRTALGASPSRLGCDVLLTSLIPVGWGAFIGIGGAASASHLIGTLLFGTPPIEPMVYGAAATVLAVVTLVASLGPARRAATIDPVTALRDG